MLILGLDMAQKTGWCLLDDGKIIESGVQDFTKARGESNGLLFLKFRKWLVNLWFNSQVPIESDSRERLAWAAGFFDGEGCTGCGVGTKYVRAKDGVEESTDRICIQLHQVNKQNLERFQEIVGLGKINGPYTNHPNPNAQPIYQWRSGGLEDTQKVISLLWPWLGEEKRKQAELAIGRKVCNFKNYNRLKNEGLIVFEMPHYRGGHSTEILSGMMACVMETAAQYRINTGSVHTMTVKKFACGSGKASKEQMIENAKEILGRDPIDDNEADAIHIARWAESEYGEAKVISVKQKREKKNERKTMQPEVLPSDERSKTSGNSSRKKKWRRVS